MCKLTVTAKSRTEFLKVVQAHDWLNVKRPTIEAYTAIHLMEWERTTKESTFKAYIEDYATLNKVQITQMQLFASITTGEPMEQVKDLAFFYLDIELSLLIKGFQKTLKK